MRRKVIVVVNDDVKVYNKHVVVGLPKLPNEFTMCAVCVRAPFSVAVCVALVSLQVGVCVFVVCLFIFFDSPTLPFAKKKFILSFSILSVFGIFSRSLSFFFRRQNWKLTQSGTYSYVQCHTYDRIQKNVNDAHSSRSGKPY